MACFNHLYFCNSQPIDSHSAITIRSADSGTCAQITRWLGRIIQIPIRVPHMLHTVFLMVRNQEMIVPIGKQIVPGRAIHCMASPTGAQHVVTSTKIARKILDHYRNESQGLFYARDNLRLFLPVLEDLFEKPVTQEDFLFTCQSAQTEVYRKAILDFFGPRNLPTLRRQLKDIVQCSLDSLDEQNVEEIHCSGREFTEMFTVAVISNLLLGKKAQNLKDYEPISQAIQVSMEHAMMKFVWIKPTVKQKEAYKEALQVLRDTIEASEGPFLEMLKATDMTDLQRKGLLFLMYIAGGDTSASLLEYMLWQLGRNPEFQNKILNEPNGDDPESFLNRFVLESLRLHTPVALIGRTPGRDLEICVENPRGSSWKYLVPKGETLLITPYYAGRSPESFEDPTLFDPNRKESIENGSLLWNPFGRGKHGCPGKWLALTEIKQIIKALVERYEISSTPNQPPRQKELLTLILDPKVSLILKKRMVNLSA